MKDIYFKNKRYLITPKELKIKLPISKKNKEQILNSRKIISDIISGKNHKLLIICGPCSIHNIDEAIEYSKFLKKMFSKIHNNIYLVMRVYFEKPRTILGWKGLINDPYMDHSFNINKGLYLARELLIKLVKNNIPLATEILDPNTLKYLDDLLSWIAIGARTVESQVHREIASSVNIPVGFKNNIDGNISSAINAIQASAIEHHFISLDNNGKICIIDTKGNKNCHLILRGGKKPNYYKDDILSCEQSLLKVNLKPKIMIDCSHGNSNKDFKKQILVIQSIISQIKEGNNSIIGIMLESYIKNGNQILNIQNYKELKYGISITDGCIDLQTTKNILYKINNELDFILKKRLL
ncbi:3-deoxy-7-phosphoheptulonate synthase [Enterobacteriaceae endosymbiont of Donacia bicoloricornis]|uniref:3-deoxy-7-phosphoheptulonate synthase n=1 Tax=Enterobacteriaceae endosymbiont of Donacia bicoloricornis TaxID=2675772 RepID=UPI0014490AE0|nr:3-deoxy-7-phosphoheptulonate synthase [Enterobacteriaceae endosymbiont of Donacia bicoloricornis]QJC37886.1 3-deoxy-7-phosphoheptulonate synthase [Enterobacteriaceae endosymbiont of Donacia bicoloricornis]